MQIYQFLNNRADTKLLMVRCDIWWRDWTIPEVTNWRVADRANSVNAAVWTSSCKTLQTQSKRGTYHKETTKNCYKLQRKQSDKIHGNIARSQYIKEQRHKIVFIFHTARTMTRYQCPNSLRHYARSDTLRRDLNNGSCKQKEDMESEVRTVSHHPLKKKKKMTKQILWKKKRILTKKIQ